MIIRIFKTTIYPEMKKDFERDFNSISIDSVKSHKGFISCQIGKPTKWNPNEYSMITLWEDEDSLIGFAGKNWHIAVIPPGMEKYPTKYSVDHFIV
jgi:heme-degrading monooxygenase HmoA